MNKNFPNRFYIDLDEDDMIFLEGLGVCDFTLCYWKAVTDGTLSGASRSYESDGVHEISMACADGWDVLTFNIDGSFKSVVFEPLFPPDVFAERIEN